MQWTSHFRKRLSFFSSASTVSSTLWQWEANYAYRLQKSEDRPSKITLVICRDAIMNQAQINFLVASAFTDSRHARTSYAAWRSTEVNSAYQNRPWMVRCSLKWKAYTDIFFSVSHARTCFRFFSVIVFDFISKRGKNCAKTTGPKKKNHKERSFARILWTSAFDSIPQFYFSDPCHSKLYFLDCSSTLFFQTYALHKLKK